MASLPVIYYHRGAIRLVTAYEQTGFKIILFIGHIDQGSFNRHESLEPMNPLLEPNKTIVWLGILGNLFLPVLLVCSVCR